MRRLTLTALALAACTSAQEPPASRPANVAASATEPFRVEELGEFDQPFGMAFLANGDLLVTEKAGTLKLRRTNGTVEKVWGVPSVAAGGQGGLLAVAVAPSAPGEFCNVYITYAEPSPQGSQLAIARGCLEAISSGTRVWSVLGSPRVIWRSGSPGKGGQFGAAIALAPDGKSLFLASGERQRFTPAQDPDQALGKIVHLTLDGRPAPDNPRFGQTGAAVIGVIDPPKNTAAAATAPTREWRSDGPNTAPAVTWTSGHRNPYGLAFDGGGRLWELEMGPKGGDELNLLVKGRNYGWPRASNGTNYDGLDIPDHRAGDGFEAPRAWWNPSISPGGMIIYSGALFPAWRGSALIVALSGEALIRVKLDGDKATPAERWNMGTRLRAIAQAPDGAVWLLSDEGKLMRLSPTR